MLSKLIALILVCFFGLGGYVAVTAVTLPNVRRALETGVEPSQTSQIFARDNTLIMSYGKYQHKPMPLSQMSPALKKALIATEDRRFYQHKGIDPLGVARAAVKNIKEQGVHEGGSTLTQQLARNIFLSQERSVQRKVKEALLAIKLEQQLTKDQILELYLNNIYFGEGAYGVGAASNIYFGKSPKNLTVAESALLAGLPQAPSLYNPFSNPELAKKRRDEVIQNLVETSQISQAEANRLKQKPLRLNPLGRSLSSSDKAPFFNRYVIQQVVNMLGVDEQTFWQKGVKVYTTLDPTAQRVAQENVLQLSNAFGRTGKKQQAALLSMSPSGDILAYVGGKDFSVSQFDRVSQAKRPAGSLFKVFVYTTAMDMGISPLTVYKDAPIEFGNWKPQNYDKKHKGFMTLAQALAQSNNIVAVKLLRDVTPQVVIQMAQKMGISAQMDPNLSMALGAVDVSLKEMTAAFNVLNSEGVYTEPFAIQKIVNRKGQVLFQHHSEKRRVLKRLPRDTMVALMQGVVKFGTAKAADIGRPVAGKTGTSDDYRDAWFIGFTPQMTTGVWVGNDDNSPMSGVTGGSLPARIWRGYMVRVLAKHPARDFDLAYSIPVEEKDFYVYNRDNLSDSEKHLVDDPELEQPPPSESDADGALLIPEPTSEQFASDNPTSETSVPSQQISPGLPQEGLVVPMDRGAKVTTPSVPAATPSSAAPRQGNASQDRFFDFRSGNAAPADRYMGGNSSSPTPPRPVSDPVYGPSR